MSSSLSDKMLDWGEVDGRFGVVVHLSGTSEAYWSVFKADNEKRGES
jgi:hypothetical protein